MLLLLCALRADAVPPTLNYAGQVAVNGQAFDGQGLFKFALVNAEGNASHWSNDGTSAEGSEPQDSVSVSVNGGLYSILLGNSAIHGMSALDPAIFQQHPNLRLRVWFNDGVNGFQQLSPDRPFASVPYAFSAGSAPIANGSISRSMLAGPLKADLNASIKSITRDMLPPIVLADLNKTISRSDLPSSVLADLNRTISKSMLGSDVLSDLNSSISLNRLSPEVLAALQVTPSISTQPFARYDWRTDSAVIEVSGRGHNLSYQWLKNGQVISDANTPILELSNPVLDDNASYAVRITNSVGEATSQTLTLQQAIGAPGPSLTEANATQVPRYGLVLWMDANDLDADGQADNLVADTPIQSWTDKISDKNGTQSNLQMQPSKSSSGGLFFEKHDTLVVQDLNETAKQIFLVLKGNLEGDLVKNELGKNQIGFHSSFVNRLFHGGGNYRNLFSYSTGTIRVSGGPNDIKQDEGFVLSVTRGDPATATGHFSNLILGANYTGEINEILFYDRVLTNSERDDVERYLADKWSIQLHADKLAAEQAAYDAAKPPAESENGLIAYYKFEPVSIEPDKVWDHSGNDNHGTLQNFMTDPWVDGAVGKALSFDGVNDKVKIPQLNGEFHTLAIWVNIASGISGNGTPQTVFSMSPVNWAHASHLKINRSIATQASGHFSFNARMAKPTSLQRYRNIW